MPVKYQIDHTHRIVVMNPWGVLTDEEVFSYKKEVWSKPEVYGYDELVDLEKVSEIKLSSLDRVAELAKLSVSMDVPGVKSKLAIIATQDFHFGLGRMYEAHRGMSEHSTKAVRVFRNRPEALEWLNYKVPV